MTDSRKVMNISFNLDSNGKSYEFFVRSIFSFLKENNFLITDNKQHTIAIQLKQNGHHIVLQNLYENKDAKNMEFIDNSFHVDTKKTIVFSYDSKHITMTFSGKAMENKKGEGRGTEKYVNVDSKSFIFDRVNFNFIETKKNSLNNLLDLIYNDKTLITSNEANQPTDKIRLKFLSKDKEDHKQQMDKLSSVYSNEEMLFYNKNQDNYRVEAVATRFTCSLKDLISAENAERLSKIPSKNKLAIFSEIITQLEKRQYPHGDLKPQNIFLKENIETNSIYIKILDADCAKIDGHIRIARGGASLKSKLEIKDIAKEIDYLSNLFTEELVDQNLMCLLTEISEHLREIGSRNPLSGCDADLEKIYGIIMRNISLYVSSFAASNNADKPSTSTYIESIKVDINQVINNNPKLHS